MSEYVPAPTGPVLAEASRRPATVRVVAAAKPVPVPDTRLVPVEPSFVEHSHGKGLLRHTHMHVTRK